MFEDDIMLEKLLEKPSKKLISVISVIAIVGFIILTIIFRFISPNTNATTYGIIDFELAFTSEQIGIIFNVWNSNPLIFNEQTVGIFLDSFLYIPCYALSLLGVSIILSRSFKGKLQKIGLFFAILPIIAALCDIIENMGLLNMLNNYNSYIAGTAIDVIPIITSICATIKFLLLFISILFVSVASIYWLINRVRKKEN
ncbi:MAG: hypothetical protein GF329_02425 [Candidatus Lokiarchaeota archaeon]|nr:hypothetical protein [Candidatus Lokiarchaeota archaeon]